VSDRPPLAQWRTFWTSGGWVTAVLAAVLYLALYLGAGKLGQGVLGADLNPDTMFESARGVVLFLLLPLVTGSVILLAFTVSLGWTRTLFARQPVPGRRWMWLAPVLVAAAIVLRAFGIDYGGYPASVIVLTYLSGLLVGFSEEILSRGIVVRMLRAKSHPEWVVMVVSSLIFALMHSTNILSGQAVLTVMITMVFAFTFGICMYLTLRVTGNLAWAMLLHGLYDPTLILASGGIDRAAGAAHSPLLELAAPANAVYLALGAVALLAVRGRVPAAGRETRRT